VVVPDLRNHGQSPHAADHSYPAMVGDLQGLLDRLGFDAVTIVGHSMGGKAAMQFALTSPNRVAALVVVDIAPVAYTHDFDLVLNAFNAVRLAEIGSRADAEEQMRPYVDAKGLRAFLLQNLVKQGDRWHWRLNLKALADNSAAITGFPDTLESCQYTGPTAFIHGEDSDYVDARHHARIRALFPHAQIISIPNAGHWVYADQPVAFIDNLGDFLRDAE
jgi:pimeloyl-ACP methyl ester carboxylesterase